MNIRGMGADQKFLALKEILSSNHPSIILIQETMHATEVSIRYFRRMFPLWHIVATDANGLSGGLIILWNPSWIAAKEYKCFAGILSLANIQGLSGSIYVLNIYAPYKDRYPFWNRFLSSDFLELDYLLIGGDLNCTLCGDEVWGGGRKVDPLVGYIKEAILQHNMIDISPQSMGPTWDNGKLGVSYLAKRLDRFFISDNLLVRMGRLISPIINSFISNHRPISLQWGKRCYKKGLPYKFNRVWLEDEEFNDLVIFFWSASCSKEIISPSQHLLDNLRELKVKVKAWQRKKLKSNRDALKEIQANLDVLAGKQREGNISFSVRNSIHEVEKRRHKILAIEEAS